MSVSLRGYIFWFTISLLIVTIALLIYSIVTKANILLIFSLYPLACLFIVSLYLLALICSGVRLYFLTRAVDVRISTINCIVSRFASQAVSNITPSFMGGEIVRIVALRYIGENANLYKALAIVLYEILFDVAITNIISLITSAYFIFVHGYLLFIMPFIASLYLILFWFITFLIFLTGRIRGIFMNFISAFISKFKPSVSLEHLIKGVGDFVRTLLSIKNIIVTLFLTILAILFQASTIYFSYFFLGYSIGVLHALLAYCIILALGVVPTPGGAGGVEFGAYLMLKPSVVVVWRILTYHVITFISMIFLVILVVKYGLKLS